MLVCLSHPKDAQGEGEKAREIGALDLWSADADFSVLTMLKGPIAVCSECDMIANGGKRINSRI